MNGLKYFLLQLKDCMMETSFWLGEGPWALKTFNSHLGGSLDLKSVENKNPGNQNSVEVSPPNPNNV